MAMVHVTDKSLENAIEWVLTNASELRMYLVDNGISLDRKARHA
jgi:hypothetical protein